MGKYGVMLRSLDRKPIIEKKTKEFVEKNQDDLMSGWAFCKDNEILDELREDGDFEFEHRQDPSLLNYWFWVVRFKA